ncbi:MAG: TonB-dependent receptor, partial [Candidatus Omnitrophica bacterium]|nr:TonB-dependent receptor [Candidatus Omnitrophota bacterium]
GKEKDAYQRTSINSKIGFSPNEDIDIGLSALYLRARYDNDDGAFEDDPNNWMKYENALIAFYVNNRIGNFLSQSLKYSWLRNVRQSFDDPDKTDTTEYYRAWFKGWLQEAELSHTLDTSGYFNFSDNITDTTLAGLQYNHEAGKDFSVYGKTPRITSDNLGFFIENKIGLNEKLFNSIAFRLDDHSRFGSHLTGRTTLSYLLAKETRVKGSYGSGFNAPSLYQLFSDYGNPNLNPEKSWGYDLGFEQDFFSKQAQLGLTFFHNRYKDLITFDSLAPNPKIPYWPYGLYANKGSAKTEGVEVSLNYKISDNLRFGYDFTYTKALDLTDNIHLLRRPNNKHRLAVNYSPWNLLTIDFEIIRNVKIYDSFSYGAAPSRLKDYTVANLSLSYNLKENIEIYTKIENIFDELYQEVNGYSVKPRFYHFGITARF